MKNFHINQKIKPFKKTIFVEGDKSLSIRRVLMSSLSKKSISYNLLKSEDVISSLNCIKALGSKANSKKQM